MPQRKKASPTARRTLQAFPAVQRYKATFMQRIADHVRLGYVLWTDGTVPTERARSLVRKFHDRYGTGLTRHQKAYARGLGQASAALMLWPAQDGQSLHWMLMLTAGENLAHELESLHDATMPGGRVALTGYELVQLPRMGSAKPSWTWRMTNKTYDGWRGRLVLAARRGAVQLSDELAQLTRTPGFAGNRAQVRKLLQLARAEARRRLGDKAKTVQFPGRIGYVQRLSQTGQPLVAWLREQKAQPSGSSITSTAALD